MAEIQEVWKSLSILGFSKYEVSNLGRFRNIEKKRDNMVTGTLKAGVPYAFLTPDDTPGKGKSTQLNRLIATIFVANPENKRFVKHKDNNVQNLRADNLYWETASNNSKEGKKNQAESVKRPIYQLDDNRNIIKKWNSVNDAANEINCGVECLRKVINYNRYYKDYYWTYCDIYDGNDTNMRWKLVEMVGYKTVMVSDTGIIKSKNGRLRFPNKKTSGYFEITLTSKDKNSGHIAYGVHRLVAIAFVARKEEYKNIPLYELYVNHRDGHKHNNDASNLEWVTAAENIQHAHREGLINKTRVHRKVLDLTEDGEIITTYDSVKEAANIIGISEFSVYEVCRGDKRCVYGHFLSYE